MSDLTADLVLTLAIVELLVLARLYMDAASGKLIRLSNTTTWSKEETKK